MKLSKRVVAGLSGTVLAASALMIVGASPATAAAPTGGCWVYAPTSQADPETTSVASDTSSGLAAWADPAAAPSGPPDYVLSGTGGATVGSTRNFTLSWNKGVKSAAPATADVYWYFSANGVNLPPIVQSAVTVTSGTQPAGSVSGSFPVASAGTNTVTFRKLIYVTTAGLNVQCNGQTQGNLSPGVNPATTPVNTNITNTFTATGPTTVISSVSNQAVTTHARPTDTISFSVSNFADGTGTASLCNVSGSSCDALTSSVTIAGGTGTGTLSTAGATTGSRALKVVSSGDTSLTPITILAGPTFTTNVVGGGAGTVVTFSGSNWDPSQAVTVGGYKNGPPFPPPATADATINVTADPSGTISGTYTVQDSTTGYVGGSRFHSGAAGAIFASAAFTFSGDSCNAKIGAAATGSCKLLETVDLTISPGNLAMSKQSGNVALSAITLNGSPQAATGDLKDVTVTDYRGGSLGWSLVARFSGLTGPAAPTTGNYTIPSTALTWTPSCTAGSNNDDTITTGSSGTVFTTGTTDVPVCTVTGVAALGADLTSGGNTVVDSPLSLAIPANQKVGPYTGTIQFTLS